MQFLERDDAQGYVIQPGEERVELVGKLRGGGGRGLPAEEPGQACGLRLLIVTKCRLAQDMPASPLLAGLMTYCADRLADRDREQDPPEIVAIGQFGELALASAVAKALKSTQGDIFLVDRARA